MKLIDLLNNLAVAEAETNAIEAQMRADGDAEAHEDAWDKAYAEEMTAFKAVIGWLEQVGIERKVACKMVRTRRTELVKIAELE
jgi:hypothetical protein